MGTNATTTGNESTPEPVDLHDAALAKALEWSANLLPSNALNYNYCCEEHSCERGGLFGRRCAATIELLREERRRLLARLDAALRMAPFDATPRAGSQPAPSTEEAP